MHALITITHHFSQMDYTLFTLTKLGRLGRCMLKKREGDAEIIEMIISYPTLADITD